MNLSLLLKGIFGSAANVLCLALVLLAPAGTLQWTAANQFLICYGIVTLAVCVFLAIQKPASLEARLEMPVSKSQPRADKIATAFLILALFGWLVFIPIDVFYLHFAPPPALPVRVFGALTAAAGYGVIVLAIYQNEFATPTVRDQSERGQVLKDTGLYGTIRHPFYAGLLPFCLGLALWLESYAALVCFLIVLAALAGRIFVEESVLDAEMPGYKDYKTRVRYRLLPFIW